MPLFDTENIECWIFVVFIRSSFVNTFAGNTLTTTVSFSPTIADISGGNSDLLFCLINLSAVLPISDVPLSSKSLNSSSQVPSVPYRDILYLFTV